MPPTETAEAELRIELTKVRSFTIAKIEDQQSYNNAVETLSEIKTFRKKWATFWAPKKEAAHKTWKLLSEAYNEGDDPAEKAEKIVKAEIVRFDDEQRRIHEELQRKAQEEAQRLEDAKRTETAVELQDQGISEEDIESFLEAPSTAIAAPVAPTYQRATGISRRDNWKAVVTDMKALCKAIGAGKVPVTYVLPNESVLNARAKADTTTLSIPGVVAKNEPIIAGRGR